MGRKDAIIDLQEEELQFLDRAILIGVQDRSEEESRRSMAELSELARTAGAEVLYEVVQKLDHPDRRTYLGSGKLLEVKGLLEGYGGNCIIADDELTPGQMRQLEEALECKVLDRTLLILDIFAGRARTSEGKIQVELAQLKYRQQRLSGLGTELSRLGGGIGTRGPGEKKLEMDRRLIRKRVDILRAELKEVEKHRQLIREGRSRKGLTTAAIVGYTNAGKSTLLNRLTGADVLQENLLFATLDPTTRELELPGSSTVLLTDTVGFIQKLPHHLVDAFRSTLEEVTVADVILHVVDASNPDYLSQMDTVYETLQSLHAGDKPVITLFNKMDQAPEDLILNDPRAETCMEISAKNGTNLERFLEVLEESLHAGEEKLHQLFGYDEMNKIELIRKYGRILEQKYEGEGILVDAFIPVSLKGKL